MMIVINFYIKYRKVIIVLTTIFCANYSCVYCQYFKINRNDTISEFIEGLSLSSNIKIDSIFKYTGIDSLFLEKYEIKTYERYKICWSFGCFNHDLTFYKFHEQWNVREFDYVLLKSLYLKDVQRQIIPTKKIIVKSLKSQRKNLKKFYYQGKVNQNWHYDDLLLKAKKMDFDLQLRLYDMNSEKCRLIEKYQTVKPLIILQQKKCNYVSMIRFIGGDNAAPNNRRGVRIILVNPWNYLINMDSVNEYNGMIEKYEFLPQGNHKVKY